MEKLLLNATETARLLKLSNETVSKMLKNGDIPAYKDGTIWKIPATLLVKAVEARALKETEERRKK